MNQHYEVLMLAVPEITQDEIGSIEKQLDEVVRNAKGSTVTFDRWGKYKLAYPVKKNEYGVYLLTRFEVPEGSTALDDIKTTFAIKLNNIVMRNVVTVLDGQEPLIYQRPKSLEEAPETGDTRGFIRDRRRVEGLISAVSSSDKRPAAPAASPSDAQAAESSTESVDKA